MFFSIFLYCSLLCFSGLALFHRDNDSCRQLDDVEGATSRNFLVYLLSLSLDFQNFPSAVELWDMSWQCENNLFSAWYLNLPGTQINQLIESSSTAKLCLGQHLQAISFIRPAQLALNNFSGIFLDNRLFSAQLIFARHEKNPCESKLNRSRSIE